MRKALACCGQFVAVIFGFPIGFTLVLVVFLLPAVAVGWLLDIDDPDLALAASVPAYWLIWRLFRRKPAPAGRVQPTSS